MAQPWGFGSIPPGHLWRGDLCSHRWGRGCDPRPQAQALLSSACPQQGTPISTALSSDIQSQQVGGFFPFGPFPLLKSISSSDARAASSFKEVIPLNLVLSNGGAPAAVGAHPPPTAFPLPSLVLHLVLLSKGQPRPGQCDAPSSRSLVLTQVKGFSQHQHEAKQVVKAEDRLKARHCHLTFPRGKRWLRFYDDTLNCYGKTNSFSTTFMR